VSHEDDRYEIKKNKKIERARNNNKKEISKEMCEKKPAQNKARAGAFPPLGPTAPDWAGRRCISPSAAQQPLPSAAFPFLRVVLPPPPPP